MFAVQGPKSLEMLNSILSEPVDTLRFFAQMDNKLGDIEVMINRGGFTGEKYGYEIYCKADDTDAIEAILKETAPKFGGRQVTDFQVMAWTLPTESGFYYMRDLAHTNPFEVGLADNID